MIRNPAFEEPAPPPAWIEVDLAALRHNLAVLRARLASRTELWAVVKGDAYGHGAVACAREALRAGTARLVVARLREADELRQAGIDAPLLLLGPLQPEEAKVALRTGAAICVGDLELARALSAAASAPVDVHVKVDTGMARYGVPAHAAAAFVRLVAGLPRLRVRGIASHLVGRGPEDLPGLRRQAQAFHSVCSELEDDGLRVVRHLANTLGLLSLPRTQLDAVRIGGGMYGFDPCLGTRLSAGLRPVLALKSRLVAVKPVPAGTCVGYGGTWTCERDTRLGVLPLGYGDGLWRAHWQGAHGLVRGVRVAFAGLINMQQTVLDLGPVPDAQAGDEVVLIGAQGRERLLAEERVPDGGSVYEITCGLPAVLPRVCVEACLEGDAGWRALPATDARTAADAGRNAGAAPGGSG